MTRRQRFDDEWFLDHRDMLLRPIPWSESPAEHHPIEPLVAALGDARLWGTIDITTQDALRWLAPRHSSAARAHLQFYRAALLATGLLPSDRLVNAAVQIEWLWYTTPFKGFYRDHLAHVLKVATTALWLLEDRASPLSSPSGQDCASWIAQQMADGSFGSSALRAAALRRGVSTRQLREASFWKGCVLTAVRVAALLHDIAYPDIMASKVVAHAMPVRPRAHFERDDAETWRHAAQAMASSLVTLPFRIVERAHARDGLTRDEVELCAQLLEWSHSLRAGYTILRLTELVNEVWRLSPFLAFSLEWAALAASLHDYDKLFELRDPARVKPALCKLRDWVLPGRGSSGSTEVILASAVRHSIRPCFHEDPVSYIVALADQLQEFGRLYYKRRHPDSNRSEIEIRYPCQAVILEVAAGPWPSRAWVEYVLYPDDPTSCCRADDDDLDVSRRCKLVDHTGGKQTAEGSPIFGRHGWLDHEGLFKSVSVKVTRMPARSPALRSSSSASTAAGRRASALARTRS